MTKTCEEVDLDNILSELGQFGRYQVINYCLILIPILLSAVYNSQYVFNAATAIYRCQVPECETPPLQFEAGPWASWSLPDDVTLARCLRLQPSRENASCSAEHFHQNATQPCDSWVYGTNDSIVATFDLACQEWKRTLVGTIHSAGMFVALPLTGYVSDTFGRRTALVLTSVLASIMGVVRSFSSSYIMYVVFEFLESFLGSGVYSTGFILALEMVGLKHRVLGGNIMSCCYAIGQVTLALTAWAVPYWRNLTRILYAPSVLFILYFFVIEESVRWLLSKGKRERAARIVFKAADMNKKKISPEYIKQLSGETNEKVKPDDEVTVEDKVPSLVSQVLRSKIIVSRVCICSFWWMTVTFIYFGLSINSVSLGGNSYVNYILVSLVEIPGYCLSVLTLDRFGRKSSIMTGFFVCGISLFALPFIPETLQWLATTLNMLGKLCISMSFSSVYIYTSELFPTTARHSLLGLCSMLGRVGSLVAPQTPLLMTVMASLPYLIFGAMAICSGLLMILTPETLNVTLPDTIAQAENMAKKNNSIELE